MKNSIRTRFTMGMIFLFLIILILSVFSGYYLNKLSGKTSAILKENYLSVVYARDMSEGIMFINQTMISGFLAETQPDSARIAGKFELIERSLLAEKNNITEPGEGKLVADIDSVYRDYKNSVNLIKKSKKTASGMESMEAKSGDLYQLLTQLSQMNGKAIESKTDDARSSAKSALTRMTVLASLCFLIGMSFTFSFASYFNRRFNQLYHGIKQIVSSKFNEKLFFDGNDEFYEISLVFNEMADVLKKNEQKLSVTLPGSKEEKNLAKDIEELKMMLFKIKTTEEQAAALISKLESK